MSGSLKVWSKFSVTNKAGNVQNLRIVEMPDYLREVVVEQFIKYFVHEESTFKASRIPKSAEALEELRGLLEEEVKEKAAHIVICCLDNDNGTVQNNEVIGASLMALKLKGEPDLELQLKADEMKKFLVLYHGMVAFFNEAKEFNLDRYFIDRGIFVHGDYRGLGVAQEFLKVRRMICKEYGVPINGAWMTSYGTQKAATRDGWETVAEIHYEEFGKQHNVIYEKDPPSCKFMIARIAC